MYIYYAVFTVAFLLCALDYSKSNPFKPFLYVLFCSILIGLPAFRGIGVDNDSVIYRDIFQASDKYSFAQIILGNYWENTERLFLLLNKIVVSLGGSISILLVVVAAVTGLLNYTFIYKMSPFPFTALLCYLCFFYLYRDFTQIRYGLSCAIIFWSSYHLFKGNFLVFLVLLFIALGFHNAAFVFFIIFPFIYFVKNRIFYIVLPILCTIGFFINPFPILLGLAGVPDYMQIYLGEGGGAGLILSIIGFIAVVTYVFLIVNKKSNKVDAFPDKYFRLVSLGVSLNLLFIQSAIFQRFSYELFQFIVILIPVTLYNAQKLRDRFYFVVLHFIFISFFMYYGYKLVQIDLIRPYQTDNYL